MPGFRSAMRAARGRVCQRGMVHKRAQGIRAAIAIQRIEVGIAQQHEGRRRGRRGQTAIQKMQPESGLVCVAAAIAIFGPVKGGGCGMPDEEGKLRTARQQDRQDQVAVRGKALNFRKTGVHSRRQIGLWQITPEKAAEILCLIVQQRQLGQDGNAARTGERAPALCIFGFVQAIVPINIKAGRLAAVGWRGVSVRIGEASCLQPQGKGGKRVEFRVMVHAGEDKDIGIKPEEDGKDRGNLLILARLDIPQEKAGAAPFQPDIPDGKA